MKPVGFGRFDDCATRDRGGFRSTHSLRNAVRSRCSVSYDVLSTARMKSSKLSPTADAFVPEPLGTVGSPPSDGGSLTEETISPQELKELWMVEEWVQTMVDLEEMERDHCIALALKLAPKEKISEIQKRVQLEELEQATNSF